MNAFVQSKQSELEAICGQCNVQRLWLFGSGAGAGAASGPSTSDLDFVVEFRDMPPAEHSNSFFTLAEKLELLFHVSVDLIELEPVTNPFLRQSINETRVLVFHAA